MTRNEGMKYQMRITDLKLAQIQLEGKGTGVSG